MVVKNRHRAVKLLSQQHAHHAVRQGEAGEAQHHFRPLFERVGHAVRAADHEADVLALQLPVFQMCRQFELSRRFAAFASSTQRGIFVPTANTVMFMLFPFQSKPCFQTAYSNKRPCASNSRTGAKPALCSGSAPYCFRAVRCAAVP